MIRRRDILRLALGFTVGLPMLAMLPACGKKGPPKRPDGSSGMKVDRKTLKKKNTGQ
ncbi:MAG: hypothetical protein QF521_02785 [Alphaproteobacteria bacterium]|jgi:predicted small lipoprotein YifL|nr:hypothetical protein [Alphaproteobacteria bacterium]